MIRALFKLVLVVVVLAAVAAFFMGYRYANGGVVAPVSAEQPPVVPAAVEERARVNTEKARETGAKIGETLATGVAKAEAAMDEGALTAKIKSKMALDDTVKALSIDVDTKGTVVTLSGSVHSEAERAKAVQLARETSGVTAVNDRLVIR
jgi:hyperosmotically inducible protein